MRTPENKKRVLIYQFEPDDDMSFEDFLKSLYLVIDKITGKQGVVTLDVNRGYDDGEQFLESIDFHEFVDKTPEEIEKDRMKEDSIRKIIEMKEHAEYEKLKAKFEGSK